MNERQLAAQVAEVRGIIDRLEAGMDALQTECTGCGRTPMQSDEWPGLREDASPTAANADYLAACVAFAQSWPARHVCEVER